MSRRPSTVKPWTVLNVGYPFAPVGPGAVGGAEQILSRVDRALTEAGHRSLVLAADGSETFGELTVVRCPTGRLDGETRAVHHRVYRDALLELVRVRRPQLVHLHGVDFHRYLPAPGPPVLVTLHLPFTFYDADFGTLARPGTYLHCVSETQRATFPAHPGMLAPVPNGVPIGERPAGVKDEYALCLSRIAPEKNVHTALEAARLADVPLLIGGEVFPYPEHVEYFHSQVKPRLDGARRFLGPVRGGAKERLLRQARCLLQPSLAAETSSLVIMEALAAGTPVVAFPSGAVPTLVEHGRTGFLVSDASAMAAAIRESARLDPVTCWQTAQARFNLERMTAGYFALYREVLRRTGATAGKSETPCTARNG